jgi:hypothetical protein
VNADLWLGAIGDNGEVIASEPDEEYGPDEFESPVWHSSVSEEERGEISEESFWKARGVLEHIHTFARARIVAPWALLGCVLARVLVTVSPQVQLPPLTGGRASLNLFVALSGPSGSGKDAAYGASEDCLDYGTVGHTDKPLGTGEGLAAMFVRYDSKAKEMLQYNAAALVFVGEVDTLGAIGSRQGSTILPMLRQAAMGQTLGFSNAHDENTRIVQSHAYRLCLVAGMQPTRSGVLLNDRNGGTPQRFIYMPTVDPETPEHEPEEPPAWKWERPDWRHAPASSGNSRLVRLPAHILESIKAGRREGARGNAPPVDSHSMLTREKVAAGLAILDGRTGVSEEDWSLSGVIMTVSDRTRAMCAQALKVEAAKENVGKALQEAERTLVVAERVDEEAIKKLAGRIRYRLHAAGGSLAHADLRRSLASSERDYWEAAITAVVRSGEVSRKVDKYHGRERIRYALV